jgi:hypothetical protein
MKNYETDLSTVEALKELYRGWTQIEEAAKRQFPHATPEELHKICCSAMRHALRINTK